MDGTRRDSLVGLQRLVYSSQIFTHSRTSHEDPRPVANIGENVVEVKPGNFYLFWLLKATQRLAVVKVIYFVAEDT